MEENIKEIEHDIDEIEIDIKKINCEAILDCIKHSIKCIFHFFTFCVKKEVKID
jgi:hypothetical protein